MEDNKGFGDLLGDFERKVGSLVEENTQLQQTVEEQTLEIERLKALLSASHSNERSDYTHGEPASRPTPSRRILQAPPFATLLKKGDEEYVDLLDGKHASERPKDKGAALRKSAMTFDKEKQRRTHSLRPHEWIVSRIDDRDFDFDWKKPKAQHMGDVSATAHTSPQSLSEANTDMDIPSPQKDRKDSLQPIIGVKRPREPSPEKSFRPRVRHQDPVCQACRRKDTRCRGGKQCRACESSGHTCIYKLCRFGPNCTSVRCIYIHPGQWPENEGWNVEEGDIGPKGEFAVGHKKTLPAAPAPLLDPHSHNASQGPFSGTSLRRGKPVCVHCWVTDGRCDYNSTCAVCRRAGVVCVRKICGGDCVEPRCPRLHPEQWNEADKSWTVEDGWFPPKNSIRVEDPRAGAPRRGDYWRPGDK